MGRGGGRRSSSSSLSGADLLKLGGPAVQPEGTCLLLSSDEEEYSIAGRDRLISVCCCSTIMIVHGLSSNSENKIQALCLSLLGPGELSSGVEKHTNRRRFEPRTKLHTMAAADSSKNFLSTKANKLSTNSFHPADTLLMQRWIL